MWRVLVLAVMAALLATTAGCGGNNPQPASSPPASDAAGNEATSQQGATTRVASPNQTAAQGQEKTDTKQEVTIKLVDHSYAPNRIETAVGTVLEVTAVNEGTVLHDFILDFEEGEYEVEVPKGATRKFALVFHQPGTYKFKCEQPGHLELGMKGEIVVTGTPAEPKPELQVVDRKPSVDRREVDLTLTEFRFTPSEINTEARSLTILNATNKGTVKHEIVVEGRIANFEKEVDVGETATFGVKFRVPGTYEYKCEIPGHLEAGMKGHIVVE